VRLVSFAQDLPLVHDQALALPQTPATEIPPLSSDASSISGGSQSSIDMGYLNVILSNVTHLLTRPARRARARGHGRRRRVSEAHASRSSVYETIQEESSVIMSPASVPDCGDQLAIPAYNSVYFVVS
jgi:serine/arginine repetitive matrix protein 2